MYSEATTIEQWRHVNSGRKATRVMSMIVHNRKWRETEENNGDIAYGTNIGDMRCVMVVASYGCVASSGSSPLSAGLATGALHPSPRAAIFFAKSWRITLAASARHAASAASKEAPKKQHKTKEGKRKKE